MKRLGLSSGMPPPLISTMTEDEVFNDDPAHMQTLLELFPLVLVFNKAVFMKKKATRNLSSFTMIGSRRSLLHVNL